MEDILRKDSTRMSIYIKKVYESIKTDYMDIYSMMWLKRHSTFPLNTVNFMQKFHWKNLKSSCPMAIITVVSYYCRGIQSIKMSLVWKPSEPVTCKDFPEDFLVGDTRPAL